MFDQKENPNGAVDWAERLKASMSATPAEASASDSPTADDDDLAALLRAQLAIGGQNVQTSACDLDTSEFEEETEESDPTFFDEPFVEEEAEDNTPDELPWEDEEDDTPDILPEPETVTVYHAEETEDAPAEELAAET
ncbi:MAG: hypothetical protein IKM33_00730, partial [Clostridia bacterium]|nr:hypothetical protein [Clostridia bacterium]